MVGSVNLLQNVNLSTQPISALDWSPDKVRSSISVFLYLLVPLKLLVLSKERVQAYVSDRRDFFVVKTAVT